MVLRLKSNGWVEFELGPNNKIYRPTNSHLIKIGSKLCVQSPFNDAVELIPSEVEGESCDPPIDTSNLDAFTVSLQEYFNPNVSQQAIDMSNVETLLGEIKAVLEQIRDNA